MRAANDPGITSTRRRSRSSRGPAACGEDPDSGHSPPGVAVGRSGPGREFRVWAGNLEGQDFDKDGGYTINPLNGSAEAAQVAATQGEHMDPVDDSTESA